MLGDPRGKWEHGWGQTLERSQAGTMGPCDGGGGGLGGAPVNWATGEVSGRLGVFSLLQLRWGLRAALLPTGKGRTQVGDRASLG